MFEYITGGGLAGQPLPGSLQAEGGLMLQALLAELKCLDGIRLCVPLDSRCAVPAQLAEHEIVPVGFGQDIMEMLPVLLAEADLFWPIAPETDGVLQYLVELAVACGTETLVSDAQTIRLCADKYATYQALARVRLPVVETRLIADGITGWAGDVVFKLADGVGCQDSFVVAAEQWPAAVALLDHPQRYVLQPYRSGQAASLSCLFKNGQGWLLCCNQQQIVLEQGRFNLRACLVNVDNPKRNFYRHLVAAIAEALPGLWGYIGIDVIETPEVGPLLLEINPRLTSSYAGIHQATGINVAQQVLRLRRGEPEIQAIARQTVTVNIH